MELSSEDDVSVSAEEDVFMSSEDDNKNNSAATDTSEEIPAASEEEQEQEEENVQVEGMNSQDSVQEQENNNKLMPKPKWKGEVLFPPRKKVRNPSQVWKFAGFRKDNKGILDMSVVVCGLCGEEIAYKDSPGNITRHVKNLHPLDWAGNGNTVNQTKVDDFFKNFSTSKKVKYPNQHPKNVQGLSSIQFV